MMEKVHLSLLDIDESDSYGDDEASQPSKDDDQMDVDNSIHDGPPPARGLDVLVVVSLTPDKKDTTCSYV